MEFPSTNEAFIIFTFGDPNKKLIYSKTFTTGTCGAFPHYKVLKFPGTLDLLYITDSETVKVEAAVCTIHHKAFLNCL
jgi:hypothetical protein